MLVAFLAGLVLTEALTELIVDAEVFEAPRLRIIKLGIFFEKLLTCGYCMSVWVGIGVAYLLKLRIGLLSVYWLEPLLWGLVLHRLSGVLHDFFGMMRRLKFPPAR